MESGNGETEKKNGRKGGSSGSDSVSRWSPTKEQIAMLENFYKQGIRTPNTEQIQDITTRLRAYGNIQGKNVFYWFQNHKARQRQKLKHHNQQTISYSNRFLHASHPISPNVVYSPYCFPRSGFSFYPQQPKVLERVGSFGTPRMCDGMQSEHHDLSYSTSNREALVLFPLHPTGILKEKTTNKVPSSVVSSVSVDVTNTSFGSPAVDEDGHLGNQPFFNFFTTEERRF